MEWCEESATTFGNSIPAEHEKFNYYILIKTPGEDCLDETLNLFSRIVFEKELLVSYSIHVVNV